MKAVFLDRDGVINVKPPEGRYITKWEDFRLCKNVAKAIKRLNQSGFLVILVTNQRGVALGHLTEEELKFIHHKMIKRLKTRGARIDSVYYCPHDKGVCECRKPGIGLFLQAKKDFPQIDFARSWVVGDSQVDVEAGQRLGCKTILIGNESKSHDSIKKVDADFIVTSLWQAVTKCLARVQ